ncbi:hypothetical protein JQ600_29825 [Bradyrhizobium sp. AUGA SZCCT0176]|nr:hypothetical protein [Bradyrhizobium sp. AUGA SZCCT0176]MBR1300737.1 hypothetical protein [Bradyrhizobium sp. AUGA SZCCT0042]
MQPHGLGGCKRGVDALADEASLLLGYTTMPIVSDWRSQAGGRVGKSGTGFRMFVRNVATVA